MNALLKQVELKMWHKYCLTCFGALMPIIMSLYYTDIEVLAQKISTPIILGYCIKVVILLILGFLIGLFYRSETNGLKLFQLGIAAPAIVMGLINGHNLNNPENGDMNLNRSALFSLNIATKDFDKEILNRKQDTAIRFHEATILQYDYPEESAKQEFLRGFTGKRITNNWFLIYDSYSDQREATNIIVYIKDKFPELNVQLYYSIMDPNKYDVVMGDHLEYKEGIKLQKEYSKLMDKYLELWEYNP